MSEPSNDVASTNTEMVIPPAEAPMDRYIKLLAEERECANNIKWWTERRKMVTAEIIDHLGGAEVGTVNGVEAVTYRPREQFNSTEFKKKYPNLYHVYCREITKTEFDADWLKDTRPDLYKEFQVRPLIVKYTAPGEKTG